MTITYHRLALLNRLFTQVLPSISSEFQKSNQASWLGTSYLLSTCTFTPLYGRLCDVMTAVILLAIGTLACGLSNNMSVLIAARFFSGMGGGASGSAHPVSRGLAQGVASVFNGLGMGLGGPLGGLINDRFGWRWAFLIQLPLFFVSSLLTSVFLRYTTPGEGKSSKEVLKRIDYGGSATLLVSVLSFLVFLSARYNDEQSWEEPRVILSLALSVVSLIAFVLLELCVASEPMLAPFLLKQKMPVLNGLSTFFVANCTFTIMYFFPMWFQTVALTSASTAGSYFWEPSRWMMHRTGKYKLLNLIFGAFPFLAASFITQIREDSGPAQLWFSIIPLGFGNAVVLQTMLVALLAHLPRSQMAVGTGFVQLFRGLGQVSGVGVASALFQYTLSAELRKRIHGPGADQLINRIRHSATLIASLPLETQRAARDSYAIALRAVFIMAAFSTAVAFIVRLPIPEKSLDHQPPKEPVSSPTEPRGATVTTPGDVGGGDVIAPQQGRKRLSSSR
ncbi:MFS general substrate transporter [Lactarius hatsudake]|nr:MFS general substrate transporter [Lactarius hatsudake]